MEEQKMTIDKDEVLDALEAVYRDLDTITGLEEEDDFNDGDSDLTQQLLGSSDPDQGGAVGNPTSLLDAYAVRVGDSADVAKWFDCDAFPSGSYQLAPAEHNDAYDQLLNTAREKYSEGKGQKRSIPFGRIQELTPIIVAKSVVLGIKGFTLGKLPNGEWRAKVDCTVYRDKKKKVVKLSFAIDEATGEIQNTQMNRQRLLEAFPGLADEMWRKAADTSNFPGMFPGEESRQD